ncbi:hypothetical protein LOTGIDRAFT_157345 [Lottia gigantea]|uniref:Uncharacterized protein n=1 Tax=Lottia gigantea TaxID=225164 RepID=V4B8P7_LOTGI|nr:hypothetical protein LOTGIDRAFT_157345 [Lottia gigantea]ESP02187.1 hypothetical protein LOTGIDRAFT_157345 [Lottia gigantea]
MQIEMFDFVFFPSRLLHLHLKKFFLNFLLRQAVCNGERFQLQLIYNESKCEDHVILVPNVTDVDVSSQPVDVIPVTDVIADPVRDGVAVPDHTADNEPTRGRKQKRQPNLWKRNIRKQSRSAGTEYVTRKGKLVSERKPLVAKCS